MRTDAIDWGRGEVVRVIKAFREYSALYCKLMEKVDIDMPSDVDISISIGSGSLQGVLIKFEDVKDMLPVMKFVEQVCEQMGCKVKDVQDYAEIRRRSFYLTIPIIVSVFFDSASECKFVEDGTEVKTKYRFVCPDSTQG